MENDKIKYQKTEISKWIIVTIGLSILLLTFSYFLKWGNNPIPQLAFVLSLLLLLSVLVLFYKLTITIDDEKILATFGIGLIKKGMQLSDIDINSIEEIKIPWYTGIGIRITKYGVLYNAKPGKAIRIKSKSNVKTFLVGTDDFEQIKRILMDNNKLYRQ